MLRFFLKVALLTLAIIVSNLALFVLLPNKPDSGSYLAAINDKHARLATTPAPRIIFVGSSDLAFGLDSEQIEQAFQIPVVNMGLHGALGPRLDLEAIRPYIQPGDIIIISGNLTGIQANSFYGRDDGTGLHLWLIKYRPEIVAAMNSPQQWLLFAQEYPSFLKTMLTIASITRFKEFYPRIPPLENPYRRTGFNEYGDMVAHLDLALRPWSLSSQSSSPTQASAAAATYFNDYHDFVREKGASIYMIPPPRPDAVVERAAAQPKVQRMIYEVTIPSLGEATNYQYPNDYFFDNPGHLNKTGRDVRTKQIIHDLTEMLGESATLVLE
jgi:hypothetical protein